MKLCKKILVMILAVFMAIGTFPVSASAASAKAKVKSIKVTSTPANILVVRKGQNYKLKVKVKTTGKISKKVEYSSADERIITVNNKGLVKGIKKGATKITVKSSVDTKVKKVIKVKVGTPVKKVKVSKKKVTLNEGDSFKIKVKISPKKATYKKVSYKSSDKSIVKVSKKGKVTALKEGKAVITVKAKDGSNKKAKVTVTVRQNGSTNVPTEEPKINPSSSPEEEPTATPAEDPTATPVEEPTATPEVEPTEPLVEEPTATPAEEPTATPEEEPTSDPSAVPTEEPTSATSDAPTVEPTTTPGVVPTQKPTAAPTQKPTSTPTKAPTSTPTRVPTSSSTSTPTRVPTSSPTSTPTKVPTSTPTVTPTKAPTARPTAPVSTPTITPTEEPIDSPFKVPYISTYYFNPKPTINDNIQIPLYITDYYQSEYMKNDTKKTLDLYYEIDGVEKKISDIKLGDYTLTIGRLSEGIHTFALQAYDKSTGLRSHKLYNELMVVASNTTASAKIYHMTQADLTYYKIKNNNSTNAVDLINTRDGLTKLFEDKQKEGYKKIILLKGTYRINGNDARKTCISIPSYFTVDMNGSTFKLDPILDSNPGCIVRMENVIDAHLENGTLEGDRYERQEHDLEVDGLGEGINTVLITAGKYCSLENLTIKNTTGHTIWSLPKMGDNNQKLMGFTNVNIENGKEVKSDKCSTSSMVDLTYLKEWDPDEDYLYVGYPAGYRGIRTNSAIIYVSFYDSNKSFLKTVTGCQFRKMLIPADAQYARVTVNETDIVDNDGIEGVYIYPRKLGDYHQIKNITFENTRTCALAPTTCNNLLVENVKYIDCGNSITPLPVDFEDGWDETQDVYYRNNEVISKTETNTGTVIDNAGFNHVYENCKNHQLGFNARITGLVVRNMNDEGNTVLCDLGDKKCNSYGRIYDNNCGFINFIKKDGDGVAIPDITTIGEENLAELVDVKVKNCTIKNGKQDDSAHCFGYSEKVTYDGCTFTSFGGQNAVFRNCIIQPTSYMNNKLYFYNCTFKALDGSDNITLMLNAPRNADRLFEG